MVAMTKAIPGVGTPTLSQAMRASKRIRTTALEWLDCPVAMFIQGIPSPIIAWNISYHRGPYAAEEDVANLLITRRDCTEQVVKFVAELERSDRQPRLCTLRGDTRTIARCKWEQMTLDPQVVSLLKDDFDFFFESEEWFRQAELPHRRGYLLHGPPGNGKSTAVRCMLSSRGLTAYTLRLFHPHTDDADLDDLFDLALKNRPAIVLLEDLDRAFPKSGESKTNISLQQLLNTLDGIASGQGIIVVATANEPSLLDPAILRRPGRFDRVVSFPNPNRQLRKSFFLGRRVEMTVSQADNIARASHGFSFAQLREAYIVAGQRAFERKGTISEDDLLQGIAALRNSSTVGSRASHAAGFQVETDRK